MANKIQLTYLESRYIVRFTIWPFCVLCKQESCLQVGRLPLLHCRLN